VLWVLLQVDQLRAEVARYQARLAELENDFLSLDVVANTEVRHHATRQHLHVLYDAGLVSI